MKKLPVILGFAFALLTTGGCNTTDTETTKTDDLKDVGWETQRGALYHLIRPIDFDKGARDVWGLPVIEDQWYAINMSNGAWLLPNDIYNSAGMGPTLIQDILDYKRIGVIDTVNAQSLSNVKVFEGLKSIHTIEVVCLKSGLRFAPALGRDRIVLNVVEKDS